jgi:hypothetical protein
MLKLIVLISGRRCGPTPTLSMLSDEFFPSPVQSDKNASRAGCCTGAATGVAKALKIGRASVYRALED